MPANPMSTRPRVAMLADVAAERRDLCDFLDTLDDDDWQVRSLCPAWSVHDVLAHLTLSHRQTLRATLVHVIRARGSFDEAEARRARELSARHRPAELISLLRTTADVDHRLSLSGPLDPLTDILVHWQDVARPLGHARDMRPDRALPALRHVWNNGFYGRPDKRYAGLLFVATDADWSAGLGGPEVRGPIGDLLLLATGRPSALSRLHGPGLHDAALRTRGTRSATV